MKQVFDDLNTEMFMRMSGGDVKPNWVKHLESTGIEVSPRAYLSPEFIDQINGVEK